jgi:glycosyltransferase involved in cell wall biosynthesis
MTHIAFCSHFSLEHFRGGEKWVATIANHLADSADVTVSVHSLPYAPDDVRPVDADEVLDDRIAYTEAWRHDLSEVDTAYVMYHPGAQLSFSGASNYIAGIHSWAYISERLVEPHYGLLEMGVKILYNTIGSYDLSRYDTVHTVTPAFESSHPNQVYVPNFVDTDLFHPDAAPLNDTFTVFISAAHIKQKGWDLVREVARDLPEDINICATGSVSDPNISGLGFLSESELARQYARSHVVLHPARVDTDSMVINESCASGTPVITTPLPTHVRENPGIIHAGTTIRMNYTIKKLWQEWESELSDVYSHRCESAYSSRKGHSCDEVFPQLEGLVVSDGPVPEQTVDSESPESNWTGVLDD